MTIALMFSYRRRGRKGDRTAGPYIVEAETFLAARSRLAAAFHRASGLSDEWANTYSFRGVYPTTLPSTEYVSDIIDWALVHPDTNLGAAQPPHTGDTEHE